MSKLLKGFFVGAPGIAALAGYAWLMIERPKTAIVVMLSVLLMVGFANRYGEAALQWLKPRFEASPMHGVLMALLLVLATLMMAFIGQLTSPNGVPLWPFIGVGLVLSELLVIAARANYLRPARRHL